MRRAILVLLLCLACAHGGAAAQGREGLLPGDAAAPLPEEIWALIPDEVFAEALEVGADCARNPFRAAHVDCQCLADAFLDARVRAGPEASQAGLMLDLGTACPNLEGMAGWAYEGCADRPLLVPDGQDVEAYCACVGNAYAQIFAAARRAPSSRASVDARSRALSGCTR
jgi:hypothetical protein